MNVKETLERAAQTFNAREFAQTEKLCQQVLARAPDNRDALQLLGIAQLSLGRHAEAIPSFRSVLRSDPANLSVLDALSAALMATGDPTGAEDALRRALVIDGQLAVAWLRLGLALAAQRKWPEAVQACEEAIRRDPQFADAHYNLGNVYMEQHRPTEAMTCYRRTLGIEPEHVGAHNALGTAFAGMGRFEEALQAYRRAIELDPSYPQARHNLGKAYLEQGRLEEARSCFEHAVALKPDYANAYCNLGTIAIEEMRYADAVAFEERALALDPGFVGARYNLGLARLYGGEFEGAWALYEARLVSEGVREKLRKDGATVELFESLPRWAGAVEEPGRRVAIWAEQGIGDQLLFSSLIPELVAAGVDFVYEVDGRLLGAYERAFAGSRFVALSDPPHAALREAERVLWSGSLPGFFRASRESFARQPQRLLSALPQRVAHYRGRLDELGPGLRVALSWRSSRTDRVGPKKNVALAQFAPLLAHSGVHFVDVQYGDTAAERGEVERLTGVRLAHFEEVDYFNDLEEVLAILEACDLLITTSNVNAHLGGVLGKRTWLLYLADNPPFHYWAHAGSDRSRWYPAVEIVSAREFDAWPALLAHIADRLQRMLGDTHSASGTADSSGVVLQTVGGWSAAHAQFAPPVSVDPSALGAQLRREGRLAEAVDELRRALAAAPGDGRCWSELAHALRWQGNIEEACGAAMRAVQTAPEWPNSWFNLGAVREARGETQLGIEAYRKALALKPDFAEAWSNLAGALGEQGDTVGEINAYRRARDCNDRLAPVWSNLGNALRKVGEVEEATAACRRAVELEPDFAPGWNNLAGALCEAGQHEAAVAASQRALALNPQLAEAWSNLGSALRGLGRMDDAIQAHERAVAIDPGNADAHLNLGSALESIGRMQTAVAHYRRALELRPQHPEAQLNLALALLTVGELREGWERYECRWQRPDAEARRYAFAPWHGTRFRRSKLLIWAEQGVGDEILYAGMLPDFRSTATEVTLECDPRLAPLFTRSFEHVIVVPRGKQPLSPDDFDCEVPLPTLGRWLRPAIDCFPRHDGYLRPDPQRVEEYRRCLLARRESEERIIGISWLSSNYWFGPMKSSRLSDWAAIVGMRGAVFLDLQYGDTAAERAGVGRIEHFSDVDLFEDLDGVAALVAACDLVVTVSNVTAHMAGALGRPVWLLAPLARGKFWYWFSGRSDNPWYPSMRVFSQHRPGEWNETLARIASELERWVQRGE